MPHPALARSALQHIPASRIREVANAGQDAESASNEANTYRNRVINEAKGDASKVLQASEGYREQEAKASKPAKSKPAR
jgi:regulator of protease activity HflC (stomatin/prohibitin superfamily)